MKVTLTSPVEDRKHVDQEATVNKDRGAWLVANGKAASDELSPADARDALTYANDPRYGHLVTKPNSTKRVEVEPAPGDESSTE